MEKGSGDRAFPGGEKRKKGFLKNASYYSIVAPQAPEKRQRRPTDGAGEKKRIEAINKCDAADPAPTFPGGILISAKTGEGLEELKAAIAAALQETYMPVSFLIPFSRYGILSEIHSLGRMLTEEHTERGTVITVMMAREDAEKLTRKYGPEILCEQGGEKDS